MHRFLRQPASGAVLLVGVALAIAACTGGGAAPSGVASLEDPDATASPNASGVAASISPEDAMLAFARCMREHGVDVPDPQPGNQGGITFRIDASGIDREQFQDAQEACGDLMQGAGFGPGQALSPEDQDKLVEFAACMREHGIDMPDPQTAAGGGGIRIGGDGVDPGSPEFQDAMEACDDLMPGFGPRGGGGPSTNQSEG